MHCATRPRDPIAAVTHPDPYPYYAELAATPTLVYDEAVRMWVAAHPALVRDVLAHPDCRVRPVHEPVPAAIAGPAGDLFGALVRMNEGARHAGPKAILLRALAALPPELVVDRADRVAAALAAGIVDADSLNRYRFAAPLRTVAALLGCADGELARIETWTARFVAGIAPHAAPDLVAQAHEAAAALLAALRAALRASAAAPDRSPLLAALFAQEWPDEHTLLANLAGLLTQTYEATAGLLGNGIVALLRDPAADRAALAARVHGSDPAIHNTRRFAACDLRVGEAHVRAGETILLVLAAGLPFGAGRHECPGQALARTIVARALHALPAALPPVDWSYRPSVNARIPVFTPQELP